MRAAERASRARKLCLDAAEGGETVSCATAADPPSINPEPSIHFDVACRHLKGDGQSSALRSLADMRSKQVVQIADLILERVELAR